MQNYLELIEELVNLGDPTRENRTDQPTTSVFGRQLRFDLRQGFPLLTAKLTYWKAIVVELQLFLAGESRNQRLLDQKVKIWDEWTAENGALGNIYGVQWRRWTGLDPHGNRVIVDQLAEMISNLKNRPHSRRHLVLAWNPAQLGDESLSGKENAANGHPALPPCHYAFQCYVEEVAGEKHLSMMFHMRSCDTYLGLPFNIASYALLCHLIANECGYKVGELIACLGDTHLYANARGPAMQMLANAAAGTPALPTLELPQDVTAFNAPDRLDDILSALKGYTHLGKIPAAVAV